MSVSVAALVVTANPAQAVPTPTGRLAVQEFTRRATEIVTMDPDGSNKQVVFTSSDHAGFNCVSGLDLSADGTKIVAAFCPRALERIWTMNADGSNFMRIGPKLDSSGPQWSPDGSKIAMTVFGRRSDSVYVMNADGTNATRLTGKGEPPGDSPTWSSDGSQIAFVSLGARRERLMITDAAGTTFQTIYSTRRRHLVEPSWSPDGSAIAFSIFSRNYNRSDIWTIHPDGTGLMKVTDTAGSQEQAPSWSPDGAWLAFLRAKGAFFGPWDVVTSLPDGSNENRIQTRADEVNLSWGGP